MFKYYLGRPHLRHVDPNRRLGLSGRLADKCIHLWLKVTGACYPPRVSSGVLTWDSTSGLGFVPGGQSPLLENWEPGKLSAWEPTYNFVGVSLL